MILKAKHNIVVYGFFKWYAKHITKKEFQTTKIIGEITDKQLPILLIANHISWWDGFWAIFLNEQLFHRKLHFMMLEEQLRKHWLFNYSGGFSINKTSKSMLQTFSYTSELLADNNNLVLIFPQGEIQSLHNQNIKFEKGLERILKNQETEVQIIMMANMVDYFSNRKPSLFIHIKEYTKQAWDMQNIQQEYNEFYKHAVAQQLTFKN